MAIPVDCEQFRKENTVPLFPGKVQRWALARSDDDNATESLVRADVERALETLNGQYSNLEIKAVQRSLLLLPSPIVKRREQLTALPILSGKKPWYVSVEFDYHGGTETVAWPIVGSVIGSCTLSSLDWALLQVGGPLRDAEHVQTVEETIEHIAEGAKEAGKEVGKGLLAGAVAVGIAWVIARRL